MKKVCILDYGSGNVKSVYNILTTLLDSSQVDVSNDSRTIRDASHIILPGVGAFGASMEKIRNRISLDVLHNEVFESKKPFLGICVGMQVLGELGYEFGQFSGLGWIKGNVNKLHAADLMLPHIGWNNIKVIKDDPIFAHIGNNADFYFVHSFVLAPTHKETILATTDYGEPFTAVVNSGNVYGVQFHPEKSQKMGALFLQNFINLS